MKTGASRKKNRRSFYLWLLILLFLVLSGFGWLRLQQTLANTALIDALGLRTRIAFLIFSGISYGLLGLTAALALLLRWQWAPWYAPLAFFLASVLYWIDHTLLVVSPAAQANLPFEAVMTVILFLGLLDILAHPKQQRFFQVRLVNPFSRRGQHEQQSGN